MDDFGRVVVLNGTASAGKTTLARAIQCAASDAWLIVGQDDFARNLVPRWVEVDGGHRGERGADGLHFVRDEFGHLHVEVGDVGRRLLRAFRFAAAACARAGLDVIVDECKFDAHGWVDWQQALVGLRTWWVRVECDLDVCAQREAARADRAQLAGLARGQYDRAHAGARYDMTVDLTDGDINGAVRSVLAAVGALTQPM